MEFIKIMSLITLILLSSGTVSAMNVDIISNYNINTNEEFVDEIIANTNEYHENSTNNNSNDNYYNHTTHIEKNCYFMTSKIGFHPITTCNNDSVDVIKNIVTNVSLHSEKFTENLDDNYNYDTLNINDYSIFALNSNITINNNGISYVRNSSEWHLTVSINLNPGDYIITINDYINGHEKSDTITVLPIVKNDISNYYKNCTQYQVKILDNELNAVTNTNVTMNINGIFYNRTTDENGIATLSINLNSGEYVISVINPLDNLRISNTVKILSTMTGSDVILNHLDGSKYKACIADETGVPLKDKINKININRLLYGKNNDDELASLTVQLNPNNYILTAEHDKNNSNNSIVITDMDSPKNKSKAAISTEKAEEIINEYILENNWYTGTFKRLGSLWYVPVLNGNNEIVEYLTLNPKNGHICRG